MKVSQIALMTDEGPQVLPFKLGEVVRVKTSTITPKVIGFRVTHDAGFYEMLLCWTEGAEYRRKWVQDCWIEKLPDEAAEPVAQPAK